VFKRLPAVADVDDVAVFDDVVFAFEVNRTAKINYGAMRTR
jgi:hypothetical protein